MRDMAGSGDGSEARMEVKGMEERREGDGGFLRNPRKKGRRVGEDDGPRESMADGDKA